MKAFYTLLLLMLSISIQALSTQEAILIIDFGSPITHHIATCIAHVQVQSHICWYTDAEHYIKELQPKGIILAGGPSSVLDPDSPRAPQSVFSGEVPVLGICYGQQLMCVQLGGHVTQGIHPEYGKTPLYITDYCALTQSLWKPDSTTSIWMGHEDRIDILPPGFTSIAHTAGSKYAIIADDERKFYGVQFHPEFHGVKEGHCLIHAFVCDIVGAQPDPLIKKPIYRSPLKTPAFLNGCCGRKKHTYLTLGN